MNRIWPACARKLSPAMMMGCAKLIQQSRWVSPILRPFEYDAAHRLSSVTDYLYDAVGRLDGIWAPNDDNTPLKRLVAVKANLRSKLSAQRGRSHNTLAKLRNRNNYADNFIVSQHDYTYDGVGQRKTAQDKLGIYAPPAMTEAYAYDPLGNRTSKADGISPLFYVYDAANQLNQIRQTDANGALLTAMIYDANGNLTQKCEGSGITTNGTTSCTGSNVATFTYDALNQLTQVNKNGQLSQYAYDDGGRRIRKTVNGASVNYLYNGPDIQAEYQNWNQASASYTHGPNTDDPIIRVTAANNASYFHQDGLGSVVATTDQTGNLTAAQLYDAWGKPQQSASLGNLGRYGYTGREPDETGMMYYRARYYDPSIGRFTQRDPIGLGGGINRYAYVNGNPVNLTDPSGKCIGPLIPLCPEMIALTVDAISALRASEFVSAAVAATRAASSGNVSRAALTTGTIGGVSSTAGYLATTRDPTVQGAVINGGIGAVTGYAMPFNPVLGFWPNAVKGAALAGGGDTAVQLISIGTDKNKSLANFNGWEVAGAATGGGFGSGLTKNFGSSFSEQVSAALIGFAPSTAGQAVGAKLGEPSSGSNYYGNLQGMGGSGQQTLLGISPH